MLFDRVFSIIIGEEGGYSDEASDSGNWTGGAVGCGMQLGTNWGISAAAYPNVDIKNLTQDQAKQIYIRDYWTPIGGDGLPPQLALLVFDAAVNNGVRRSSEWLQAALGVATDGVLGPETMAALAKQCATADGCIEVCSEFLARRVDFMGGLKTWQSFGLGWSRRLAALPWKAMQMVSDQVMAKAN